MKLLSTYLLLLALLAMTGCGKKEITPYQRKQAANVVSEAEFAATLRDYPRAEGLLIQATTLCPDNGSYWISLGTTRMRQGRRDGAKDAYQRALSAFEDAAAKDKNDAEPALQQVYVLALLGRVDDARALQTKLLKRYPNSRDVRSFVEDKRLDQLTADPQFKQFTL